MTIRLSTFLSFVLCLFIIIGTGPAWATCATIGSASTAQQEISEEATNKFRDLEKSVNKQLQVASDNLIEAIKAMSTARTDAAAQTVKSEINAMDADNQIEKNTLVNEKMIEVTQDLNPVIEECISLTAKSRGGIMMDEITRAAESAMNADRRRDYTNDVNSPYSKGVTSALAVQFIEYIKYYCNPLANNGNMPSAEKPLTYTYPDDVENKDGSVTAAGTTINVFCGQDRAQLGDKEKFLIDADIRIDDTIFSDSTWPQDKESPYGRMLYAAASQGVRLLTPSPRDPFNPSAFKGQAGIEAFMERRAFEARLAMANAQFSYITSKRVPASGEGGLWIKDMLAKELAGDKESILNSNGSSLSEKMTSYCGDSVEESCGMWQLVKQIPDTASKNEYMNFVMRDRFLGTEYLLANSNNNEAQSQRQQIDLLILDIVQQREINETLERILGTVAAKYSLRVDQMAQSSTVGQAR